jgi:hypothetical protein
VTLGAAHAKRLRAQLRGRKRADLKQVFALVRANSDRVLLAALAPPTRQRAAQCGDPLARELDHIMKTMLAPAREKAEMLVEHMAKSSRRKLDIEPKGLADAARLLRVNFSDAQIRTGAEKLMAHLAKLYGGRETVI